MASFPSTSNVIIIHCGQVVMDKRISVDHFERGCSPKQLIFVRIESKTRRNHEQRSQAFSTAENAPPHSLVESTRFGGLGWQKPVENRINASGFTRDELIN